jgi:hypothetical protein
MRLSTTIDRRLLVSWRADPEVVARLLPSPLRPTIVGDVAVVGVCLMRLRDARPRGVPVPGLTSEGAAHRVGVEWDTDEGPRRGVYIWERYTSSPVNRLLGGRLFPGVQQRARFRTEVSDTRLRIEVEGVADVEVATDAPFRSAVFRDLDDASAYFEHAPLGISPSRGGDGLEAMRLETTQWRVDAVGLRHARSTFFDDQRRFPAGSVEPDSALLMQHVPATWSPETIRIREAAVGAS